MLYVRIYCECASVGATNKCIVSEMECRVNSLYKSLTSEYQVLTSVGGFVGVGVLGVLGSLCLCMWVWGREGLGGRVWGAVGGVVSIHGAISGWPCKT